jgi:hypothetical protein
MQKFYLPDFFDFKKTVRGQPHYIPRWILTRHDGIGFALHDGLAKGRQIIFEQAA